MLGSQFNATTMTPIPGEGFNGHISQVHAWNRVLDFETTREIGIMADDSNGLVLPGLVSRWSAYTLNGGVTVVRPGTANKLSCPDGKTGPPACVTPAKGNHKYIIDLHNCYCGFSIFVYQKVFCREILCLTLSDRQLAGCPDRWQCESQ